jgi:hypothetical protein
MNEFDPDLLRGWKMLMELDVDDLTFEYNYQIGGEIHTHVLEYSDNEPKVVTKENRQQYVQMLFDAVSDKLIAPSFNALQTGLESIIPRRVLHFFTSSQLQSLMAGQRVINVPNAVTLLKQVTVYDGYHPNHPLIIHLWDLLSNGTTDQFSKFLDLTTATDRLPASFPANFKLTIFKSGTDQEMFHPPHN